MRSRTCGKFCFETRRQNKSWQAVDPDLWKVTVHLVSDEGMYELDMGCASMPNEYRPKCQ